jgi:hypothetical protein
MKQRLFLDEIDTEAAGTTIARENDLIAVAGSNEAESSLTFPELAQMRTQIALNTTIFKDVPIRGRYDA